RLGTQTFKPELALVVGFRIDVPATRPTTAGEQPGCFERGTASYPSGFIDDPTTKQGRRGKCLARCKLARLWVIGHCEVRACLGGCLNVGRGELGIDDPD